LPGERFAAIKTGLKKSAPDFYAARKLDQTPFGIKNFY
jgi:hypothetical protein